MLIVSSSQRIKIRFEYETIHCSHDVAPTLYQPQRRIQRWCHDVCARWENGRRQGHIRFDITMVMFMIFFRFLFDRKHSPCKCLMQSCLKKNKILLLHVSLLFFVTWCVMYRPLGHERVYKPLCKVADTPFQPQVDIVPLLVLSSDKRGGTLRCFLPRPTTSNGRELLLSV